MEITLTAFLCDAKSKIDLLATAVDYAAAGVSSKTRPHSCPNVKAADQKLQNLLDWYDELERSNRKSIPACEATVLTEFLDREIAGAQYLLSAVSEKKSDRGWLGYVMLAMVLVVVAAAAKVWLF